MAKKQTWIWIIVGVLAFMVVCVLAVAGLSTYYVFQHFSTTHATHAAAVTQFDQVQAQFKGQTPLVRIDKSDDVVTLRRTEDLPTAGSRPTDLHLLVWNPQDQRLVNLSIPFWLLRLGHRKMNVVAGERQLDLRDLNLNVDELDRIGPVLVVDQTTPDGQRVLVWTR